MIMVASENDHTPSKEILQSPLYGEKNVLSVYTVIVDILMQWELPMQKKMMLIVGMNHKAPHQTSSWSGST